MYCPKEKGVELVHGKLAGYLSVEHCPSCQGDWLPAEQYEEWQSHQPQLDGELMPETFDIDLVQSPLDSKAALCPECRCYLARAKVSARNPFYLERCPNCGGIWCDRGEWNALEKLGFHTTIQKLFSGEWQSKLREVSHAEQERHATIEKLGADLAARVFELAEVLENHPNGDFGVAYLMRRFEK